MWSAANLNFRAWHKAHKKLYRVVEINSGKITILGYTNPENPMGLETQTMMWDGDPGNNLFVMQCSPFKDRSSPPVPIFELDRVQMTGAYRKGEVGMVVYSGGCFMVEFEKPDEDGNNIDMLQCAMDDGVINLGPAMEIISKFPGVQ